MTTSLTDHEAGIVAAVPTGLLIDGRWEAAEGERTFEVLDPATALPIASVADASVSDAMAALDAANRAAPRWAAEPARQRAEILRRAFELMIERREELATLITLEMGKPLAESRSEVTYAAEFFRWFSEEAVRLAGRWLPAPEGGSRLVSLLQPVGPCLLILPWNVPLAMGTRKIGPALAAGCTMVVKPATQTPLSLNALAGILAEAGLPPGVLNLVPTTEPGPLSAELMADRRLRKVSFTGSTGVGQRLARQAADRMLRMSLELGGNAPFIVFDDADLDIAVTEATSAKLRNNSEACTAANRFFVHRSVVQEFTEGLAERFAALVLGRGIDPLVTLGPLIDTRAVEKVNDLVASARAEGAATVYEGSIPSGNGFFAAPTVLSGVSATSRIVTEEIFGPVAPIVTFDDETEVLDAANASDFGLSSYVFTTRIDRAIRVAERLEVGMVGINKGVISNPAAPFGGVKLSGLGREGGFEGINEYVTTKYVAISTPGN